jgi:hypothetical protein
MVGRRNGTAEKKRLFLDTYRTHGTIYHAAQAADVGRRTVYNWREADPEFAQAMDDAHEDATDALEESGYRRAIGGDTTLTIFLLKGRRREVYGDRLSAEHSGPGGAPLPTVLIVDRIAGDDSRPLAPDD